MKVILIVSAVHLVVCLVLAGVLSARTTEIREEKTGAAHSVEKLQTSVDRTAGVIVTGHTHAEYLTSFQIPTALVVYFLSGLVGLLGYGFFGAFIRK